MAEISSASTEQASGISQVLEAVGHMDRMTQQNAALVEETAAASQGLRSQADQVSSAMAHFHLEPVYDLPGVAQWSMRNGMQGAVRNG